MANIELRNHSYSALLIVPEDVREIIGKVKFRQALGTGNKREAELLAAPFIAKWKAMIKQARGQTNAVQMEAMKWQHELSSITDNDQQFIAEDLLIERTKAIEKTEGSDKADDFFGIATSTRTPSNILFEQWKDQIELEQKTKDQMVKDVEKLLDQFKSLEGITKNAVHQWAWDCLEKKTFTASSLNRTLSSCRNYWRYLQKAGKVYADNTPLNIPALTGESKKSNKGTKTGWIPFEPADVVTLWKAAGETKKNEQLANLIMIGAYTGARIEELCSLKKADFKNNALTITDAKTEAGNRTVPVHSALLPLIKKLAESGKDEYLIPNLTLNKYGDRSNAIGKRFGRLKTAKGFGPQHVFHSIRKTLTTLLENAGITEGLAADIVGHEKPNITFGLYSGGHQLEVMRAALEKVSYPFNDNNK